MGQDLPEIVAGMDSDQRARWNRERVLVADQAEANAETGQAPTPERAGVAGIDRPLTRGQVAQVLGSGFESVVVGDVTVIKCPRYDDATLAAVLRNGVPTGIILPQDASL